MQMDFKIRGRRLIARQIGSGDWQDIFAAADDTAHLIGEFDDVCELLIDLRAARLTFYRAEAGDLAETFEPLLPRHLHIAILMPAGRAAAREVDGFVEALRRHGFKIAVFEDCGEVEEFFAQSGERGMRYGFWHSVRQRLGW